ncbi:MAG: hypothetical protein ACKV2Q_15405 [Planctomycetaceae bacterium]
MNTVRRISKLVVSFCVLSGCGGRVADERFEIPQVVPQAAGARAVSEFDTNGNGAIDGQEWQQQPALKASLKAADSDGDGQLTAGEIADRLAFYRRMGVGLTQVVCVVTWDGKPLSGATVRLVPEKFLGSEIKPAEGTSDTRGYIQLHTEGYNRSGVHCGFMRIAVSKLDAQGIETLPNRYNVQTELGYEVSPDSQGVIELRLTSSRE